jgi:hypothetical protein
MKNVLFGITGILVVIGILYYSEVRQEEANRSAEIYEKCVAREFGGRTPSEIYVETGSYPECE